MAFQLSPGVNVSEVDLTTVVPSVLTTAGAFAGTFTWGPADKIILVDNELTLINNFGKPDSNSATSFFTSASFLAYGNNLSVVRAVGATSNNAVASATNIQIKNSDVFEASYLSANNANTYGAFVARYPGTLGNSLSVDVCDNATNFANWNYKSYFPSAPSTSEYATAAGGANDEIHIVVVDALGLITGTEGTVLETYGFVSKGFDASLNGSTNYYRQVIFNQSMFIQPIQLIMQTQH